MALEVPQGSDGFKQGANRTALCQLHIHATHLPPMRVCVCAGFGFSKFVFSKNTHTHTHTHKPQKVRQKVFLKRRRGALVSAGPTVFIKKPIEDWAHINPP